VPFLILKLRDDGPRAAAPSFGCAGGLGIGLGEIVGVGMVWQLVLWILDLVLRFRSFC